MKASLKAQLRSGTVLQTAVHKRRYTMFQVLLTMQPLLPMGYFVQVVMWVIGGKIQDWDDSINVLHH